MNLHPGSVLWSQFPAIFSNFRQTNWRFFQKPMLRSKFFHTNLALFWVKNANLFCWFFGENVFKIITSVLGLPDGIFVYQKYKFGYILIWKMSVYFMTIWNMLCWHILWPFGIFCSHLVYFSRFGIVVTPASG
jgi:hypothetical protein